MLWPIQRCCVIGQFGLRLCYGLRTVFLFAAIIYSATIDIRAKITNNWDSTREMGLSQATYCTESGVIYRSREFNINSDQQSIDAPVCGYGKNFDDLCLNTQTLDGCKSDLQKVDMGDSVAEFTSFFHRSDRSYFPYSFLVYTFVSLSLVLTFLYESDEQSLADANEGAFTSQISVKWVIRFNYALVLAVAIVLIVAGCDQIFIYTENCESLYYKPSGAYDYCFSLLTACGLSLSSTIAPNESLVTNYKSWCITIGIFLIVSSLLRVFVPLSALKTPNLFPMRLAEIGSFMRGMEVDNGDVEGVADAELGHVPANEQREEQQAPVVLGLPIVNQTRASVTVTNENVYTHLYSTQPQLEPHQFDSTAIQPSAQPQPQQYSFSAYWTVVSPKEAALLEGECAFCLQPLFPTENDTEETTVVAKSAGGWTLDDNYRSKRTKKHGNANRNQRRVAPSPATGYDNSAWSWTELDSGQEVVKISCEHMFHAKCLEEWLNQHNNCPVCRATLLQLV